MTDKEALLEALEALHYCEALNRDVDERKMQAITVVRKLWAEHAMRETQRLGQEIEQEPEVDLRARWPMNKWKENKPTPPQRTEQESDELNIAYMSGLYDGKKKRTWVGLTDEEIEKLRKNFATLPAITAIEAKLKEKNT